MAADIIRVNIKPVNMAQKLWPYLLSLIDFFPIRIELLAENKNKEVSTPGDNGAELSDWVLVLEIQ